MTNPNAAWLALADAMTARPEPGRASARCFAHGTLEVRHYRPVSVDNQTPHDRDEIYVVSSGSGWFEVEGEKRRFATGDALFVAARAEHRFVDFTPDFATWVFFYGPVGGEAA